jgi:hypothetical protein
MVGKRTITTTLLALVGLALVPPGTMAAGLGRPPCSPGWASCRAEIEVVNLQRGEAETLHPDRCFSDAFAKRRRLRRGGAAGAAAP